MRTLTLHLLVAGLLLTTGCASSGEATDGADAAPSVVDEIVAAHVEALGGYDNVSNITSLTLVGTVHVPAAGMSMPITIRQQRPMKMRTEVDIEQMGVEIVNAYDGETAWSINPMQSNQPQVVTGLQAASFRDQADMEGMLVDYARKGYHVEYLGQEEVEGQPAHGLKVVLPDSSVYTVFVDAESYLEVKTVGQTFDPMSGSPAEFEAYLSDYREVNGVMKPFNIEVFMNGTRAQDVTITDMRVNEEYDDSLFAFPGAR